MVDVAQLVRVADCGSVGRGFEPHLPPICQAFLPGFFVLLLHKLDFYINNCLRSIKFDIIAGNR
jgi:hypothetical protein